VLVENMWLPLCLPGWSAAERDGNIRAAIHLE
jgi:hypothetical protein